MMPRKAKKNEIKKKKQEDGQHTEKKKGRRVRRVERGGTRVAE